jgi:hypothetical protein
MTSPVAMVTSRNSDEKMNRFATAVCQRGVAQSR